MITIIICTITGISAFVVGYFCHALSKNKMVLFPSSAPPLEGFLSQPLSVNKAKCLKKNFNEKFPGQTVSVIHDFEKLKIYFNQTLENYFKTNNQVGKTKGVAMHLGYTKDQPLRGRLDTSIQIPANRLTVFLTPVFYNVKVDPTDNTLIVLNEVQHYREINDPFEVDCVSVMKPKSKTEELLGDETDDPLIDDISHTEP